MAGEWTTDSSALDRSITRGQEILNCWILLDRAVGKPDSIAGQMVSDLSSALNDWRGDWTGYKDYTLEIVPYEVKFVQYRASYAQMGVNVSSVPVVILDTNDKTVKPQILSPTQAKEVGIEPGPDVKPEPNLSASPMMIAGIGIGAAIIGFMLFRKKSQPALTGLERYSSRRRYRRM